MNWVNRAFHVTNIIFADCVGYIGVIIIYKLFQENKKILRNFFIFFSSA